MNVIDAGVLVELVAGGLDPDLLGDEQPACPYLIDTEVTHALRGLVGRGVLSEHQGAKALAGFVQLTLTRFSAESLRPRMWELRHDLTAHDATYVALTEVIGARALLTTDARLAHAPGPECHIELL